jgi:hypothetical protein
MLRPNKERLRRGLAVLAVLLILVVVFHAPSAAKVQTQTQGPIKDGIGIGEILVGVSTAADVEARYGKKYELINKNDYSYRMDYADQRLAFYYCQKDEKKRVFLVELHDGVTSKGIIVGKSTLKDVFTLYGEGGSGADDPVYEYKGLQFYIESSSQLDKASGLDRKVVEVDIVAPGKSSNFCD